MDDTQAREHCWQQVKASLEPEKWTAGDSATFHAFFNHGWCAAKAWESHMASECQRMADEIDRLRAALTEALPALRMAYKGGHELTENDYIAYKTACELTDPPNDKAMGRREAAS